MRLGKRCSSRFSPSESSPGDARLASRSWSWRMKAAVANVPAATFGSPRSIRQSVSRLTKRRAAMSSVEMPRFLRAKASSRPNLRRACAAGRGSEGELLTDLKSVISDAKSSSVRYGRLKLAPQPGARSAANERSDGCAGWGWSVESALHSPSATGGSRWQERAPKGLLARRRDQCRLLGRR